MWKKIRILILLLILFIVAVNAYRDQNQDWNKPVRVLLHPVNADGQDSTQLYIQQLSNSSFQTVQQYLQQAAAQYRQQPVYFYLQLGRELKQLPPQVPEQASLLDSIIWSLKFRFYVWRQHQSVDGAPHVTLYLNYYDPAHQKALKHSTALEKGRIGSVNLFAAERQTQQNHVVLAHELLHAFGARDKYDLATGLPIYPLGYANPQQQPRYPQQKAELMGGHIPLSSSTSKMPDSLQYTVINDLTAAEIGWLR